MTASVIAEVTPSTPTETWAARTISGSVWSLTSRTSPFGWTRRIARICEDMLPSWRPVPCVPVASAPASAWLSMSPWLISDRPFSFSARPRSPMRVPAATVTRWVVRSRSRIPCRFSNDRSRPLVATTGVNEWPEPAARTPRPRRVASCTIEANSSSEPGVPLCLAMHDWLPTQLRQWPPACRSIRTFLRLR